MHEKVLLGVGAIIHLRVLKVETRKCVSLVLVHVVFTLREFLR